MATTTNKGLRYPVVGDSPDVPRDIGYLAADLDRVANWDVGVAASKPAIGSSKKGDIYLATDDLFAGPNGTPYVSSGPAGAWIPWTSRPPIVTSLPTTVTDGMEVLFQNAAMAALSIFWHLRYNAGSASPYKWEAVGAQPELVALTEASATVSGNTNWNPFTLPGALVLPTAMFGDFDLTVSGEKASGPASDGRIRADVYAGGSGGAGGNQTSISSETGVNQVGVGASRKNRITIPTASSFGTAAGAVYVKFEGTAASGTLGVINREVRLAPIRVMQPGT